MDEPLKQQIESLINSKKVFLFMKGTPENPACGFSMRITQILQNLNVEFDSFDIFSNQEVRQGIKDYSNWPTIPQLFINGKFIGGCDIVEQLQQSGELQKLIAK